MSKLEFERRFLIGDKVRIDDWHSSTHVKITAIGESRFLGYENSDKTKEMLWGMDSEWVPYKPFEDTPIKTCIVRGCNNSSEQGKIIGDLCCPCHNTVTLNTSQSQLYSNIKTCLVVILEAEN